MANYRNILSIIISFACSLSVAGQTNMFDKKVHIGNGIYKVSSNDRWGLVDKDDNLKLSIEYKEPLFMNGRAVLIKYGSDQIEGVLDSVGRIRQTPPYYVNIAYPFVTDGMLAVKEKPDGEWGFLDVDRGKLLTVNINGFKSNKNKVLKALGINGKNVKGSFVFDFVAPFVEGMSAVHTVKTGWHHIDKDGNERFKNPESKPTMFRSSVHAGESVLFDDRGIVLCRETPDHNAGIIKYIDNEYEVKNYNKGLMYPYSIRTNGSKLTLNMKFQADKYENAATGDSIILIERPKVVKKIKEEPKDSFTLARDIKVSLEKKSVSAGAKGTAAVTVNISNDSEFDSKELSVSIDVNGAAKSWSGAIAAGMSQDITLYVPAKFTAVSISRDVEWKVVCEGQEISGSDTISIKRYKPSRR